MIVIKKIFQLTLAVFLISCQPSEHNKGTIGAFELQIDKRIDSDLQQEFSESLEFQFFSDSGWVKIDNIDFIQLDSVLYSYLLTIGTTDSLTVNEQAYLKAYGESISERILNNRPIHFYSTYNKQYIEYDTTSLVETGNFMTISPKFEMNSFDVKFERVIALDRILNKILTNYELSRPIKGDLEQDSTLYSLELTISNPQEIEISTMKTEIQNLDPFYLYLAIGDDKLLINYKDTLGNYLTNGSYFE